MSVAKTGSRSIDDTIETLNNPRWTLPEQDPSKTPVTFDCVTMGVLTTFVASPNDPEPHGVEVWNDAIMGVYGPIGPYQAPQQTVENKMGVQSNEAMDYYQAAISPMPPGEDRRLVMTEIQASFTAQGGYFAQIPQPWNRPIDSYDQELFDKGEQAIQDTIDYLNAITPAGRFKFPPFKKSKEK
jgi:hypothetical protein